jgi:hypothetical protein
MKPNITEDRFSEGHLSEALGRLARHSERSAPPEVGAALLDAFRRRQAARRGMRTLRMTAIAALLLFAAGLIFITKERRPHPAPIAAAIQSPIPAAQATDSTPSGSKTDFASGRAPIHRTQHRLSKPGSVAQHAERSSDFMVLPGWSSAAPREQLRIVRMELPASALRMVGAPVSEEVSERPVLADFVVGQDGTPYAMRLVQQ